MVNCQLTKDWKECVLGLVRGGFSQQESSGVFLSMGHNGFSPPMKHYSGWRAGPPATWEPFPTAPPLPCQSQTQPSVEIWDRWKDGERMVEERRNVKEQWIGADGKKKGGIERNWHPSLSKTPMENRWFLSNVSEHRRPYLNTQHDTDIHTQVTITTHNTMQCNRHIQLPPYPPFAAYPSSSATSVHVHPSVSLRRCLCRLEMFPKQATLAHSGHEGNILNWNNGLFMILSAYKHALIVHTHIWIASITLDVVQIC